MYEAQADDVSMHGSRNGHNMGSEHVFDKEVPSETRENELHSGNPDSRHQMLVIICTNYRMHLTYATSPHLYPAFQVATLIRIGLCSSHKMGHENQICQTMQLYTILMMKLSLTLM